MKNRLRFKDKAITFLVMLVLLLILPWQATAKKVMEFDLAFKKPILALVNEKGFYLYDWDVLEIYFFSRETLKSPFKFGSRGEGPSEFTGIHRLKTYPNYIFVSSDGKNAYFSRDGKLIKEIKTEYATICCMPLENNFVCRKFEKNLLVVKIFDKNLQVIKNNIETFVIKNPNYVIGANNKRNYWMINDFIDHQVDENRLYIGNTQKGFYFAVYDKEGKKLYEVNRDYKKVPITAKDKEDIMMRIRDSRGIQRFERLLKKYNILFPEYFPAYSGFFVSSGKIHVMTYSVIDKKQELLILDRQGNLLNNVYVPISGVFNTDFCIFNESYYYMFENELSDKWELHEIKLY